MITQSRFSSADLPVRMLAEKRATQIGFVQLYSISSARHTVLKYAAIIGNLSTGQSSNSSKPSAFSNRYPTDAFSMLHEPVASKQRKPSVTLFAPIRKCDDSCGHMFVWWIRKFFEQHWTVFRVYAEDWGSRFLRNVFQCFKQYGSLL